MHNWMLTITIFSWRLICIVLYYIVDSNSIYGINGDIDQYHAVYYNYFYAHGSDAAKDGWS